MKAVQRSPRHGLTLAVALSVTATSLLFSGFRAYSTVIQEWNFTGGSLVSEQGLPTGYFGNGLPAPPPLPDDGLDDQYLVIRTNGFSAVTLPTAITAATADEVNLSVTISDFDFSSGNNQYFGIQLRQSGTAIGDLRFDAQVAGTSGTGDPYPDRIRLTGLAVAGVALDTTVSSSPITYGLTLSFLNNTYTYWIGTPSSDQSTWVSRYNNYTGTLNMSGVTLNEIRWGIQDWGAGNYFNLDQIQLSASVIPEPSLFALLGVAIVGLFLIRRRR